MPFISRNNKNKNSKTNTNTSSTATTRQEQESPIRNVIDATISAPYGSNDATHGLRGTYISNAPTLVGADGGVFYSNSNNNQSGQMSGAENNTNNTFQLCQVRYV